MATVQPARAMDVNQDAQTLEKAMKGLGTDEQVIIDLLSKRSVQQRQGIAAAYKAAFGKDLKERLKSELSGNFRRAVLYSFYDQHHVNAKACYKAMKGAGTDEKILVDVICSADPNEIEALKRAYSDVLAEEKQNSIRRNLEVDVKNDVSGDFEKLLVALLQGKRETEINEKTLNSDVESLHKGGEAKMGTDESVFIKIFANRSYAALCRMNQIYESQYGNDLFKAVGKETSGDFRNSLITILKTAQNRNECIADMLYDSMEGAGTHDDSLIRIIMAYSETTLGMIRHEFNNKYTKKPLAIMVKEDTSGDYEKFLLAILGEQ